MRVPFRGPVPFRGVRVLLAVLIFGAAVAGAIVPAPRAALAGAATTTTDLNLRAGPGTGYDVLLVMPPGASLWAGGDRAGAGFHRVVYQGVEGWAASAYLSFGGGGGGGGGGSGYAAAPSVIGTAVTTTDLNLRADAGTWSGVLAVMPAGASVNLTGIDANGFYYVQYNGRLGWAYTGYLSLGGGNPNGAAPGGSTVWGGGDAGASWIEQVIIQAADAYGQPRADMLRVARCESGLNPDAVNPAGSYGLFQFIPSTWASTPYAGYDIFDAWASANAAAWMWSVGRRGEWVCQ